MGQAGIFSGPPTGESEKQATTLAQPQPSLSIHSDSLRTIVLAGIAGLVAGALSMAVGEYISMSSQR